MGGGQGLASNPAPATPSQPPQAETKAGELRMLREQAEQLGRQMQEIESRIRRLENDE